MEAVQSNWPIILSSLEAEGIGTPLVQIATLATLGVEVPDFAPRRELSPRNENRDSYFVRMYWSNPVTRHRLGNLTPADAAKFYGRGFVQLTGRDNYQIFGDLLALDLVGTPDLAMDPTVAAKVLAVYFQRRRVAEAAEAQDWFRARVRVNGGSNGWDRFTALVHSLQAAA